MSEQQQVKYHFPDPGLEWGVVYEDHMSGGGGSSSVWFATKDEAMTEADRAARSRGRAWVVRLQAKVQLATEVETMEVN